MARTVLCIAPHPDDETLGCGGTLLRHVAQGDHVHWLIATAMEPGPAFPEARITAREMEIEQVSRRYGFAGVHRAGFTTMELDTVGQRRVIDAFGAIVRQVQPEILYLPYRNDAHSDHAVVFDAGAACCKSFRYPSIKAAYVYETLSETEFGLRTDDPGFRPNLFVDIQHWLEEKLSIMGLYVGEMEQFPFPRSDVCIRAQAALRGSQSGLEAAEAFVVLKEVR